MNSIFKHRENRGEAARKLEEETWQARSMDAIQKCYVSPQTMLEES